MYRTLTPWNEVESTFDLPSENPFAVFSSRLTALGIGTGEALEIFTRDYYDAECFFKNYTEVLDAFRNVHFLIDQRLDVIISNYPFNTVKQRTRAPNLTRSVSASSSGSADVSRNQTETQTETPKDNYGQERLHQVQPYDANTMSDEYKDTVTNKGSKEITTTYTGSPDHTASSSSGSRTDTETGTETITEKTIGKPGQSIAEAMEDYAAAMDVFRMIEREIAAKIFLQIWRLKK